MLPQESFLFDILNFAAGISVQKEGLVFWEV
jgi:hypothetical protein